MHLLLLLLHIYNQLISQKTRRYICLYVITHNYFLEIMIIIFEKNQDFLIYQFKNCPDLCDWWRRDIDRAWASRLFIPRGSGMSNDETTLLWVLVIFSMKWSYIFLFAGRWWKKDRAQAWVFDGTWQRCMLLLFLFCKL